MIDDNRRQPAKQYWPIRRASNNLNGWVRVVATVSIYYNGLSRCVATRVAYVDERTTVGQQAMSADRLRAGIDGLGGGGQAKIAMSRQGRGLRRRTDGRAGTNNPAGLLYTKSHHILHQQN